MRGIDVDEANFLSECDEARIKREREIRLEEKKEIAEVKISLLFIFFQEEVNKFLIKNENNNKF